MKVLVACEWSGRVRDAFAKRGHNAWSCDVLPTERPGNHIQDSILEHSVVKRGWDVIIAFPDCTFLTVSGARWNHEEWREEAQLAALHFVKAIWKFPVPKLAIENPVGRLSSLWRGPTQIIQPHQFGEDASKNTCLWLRGLPPLLAVGVQIAPRIVDGRRRWANQTDSGQNKLTPSPERARMRGETYEGIADAMAQQWG